MTASLIAVAMALTLGLPIFALGEYLRENKERRPDRPHPSPTREDIS